MPPAPTVIVSDPPNEIDPPPLAAPAVLTVKAEYARAAFGIADAATVKLGVVVEFVTVGTNHAGQEPDGAAKLIKLVPAGVE